MVESISETLAESVKHDYTQNILQQQEFEGTEKGLKDLTPPVKKTPPQPLTPAICFIYNLIFSSLNYENWN